MMGYEFGWEFFFRKFRMRDEIKVRCQQVKPCILPEQIISRSYIMITFYQTLY